MPQGKVLKERASYGDDQHCDQFEKGDNEKNEVVLM